MAKQALIKQDGTILEALSKMRGTFIAYPERESVPENIKESLIVELYSK